MKKNEQTNEARRLAAVITQNCLTSLCDETARINYDLKKIHCLGMAARHFLVMIFDLKLTDKTTAIVSEMDDCEVDSAIMADVDQLESLLSMGV